MIEYKLDNNKCPMNTKYGEIVCRNGTLWALTYSECAPPDQRQCWGECPHCNKKMDVAHD